MNLSNRILTWASITVVTVFIWYWAATETREQSTISVQLEVTAPEPSQWLIQPNPDWVNLTIEGSGLALREAARLATRPVELILGVGGVPSEPGVHELQVRDVLSKNEAVREAGGIIVSSDPATVQLSIDRIVEAQAQVSVRTLGIQTQGKPRTDRETVTMRMPKAMRDVQFTGPLIVEAVIDAAAMGELQPDTTYSRVVALTPPDGLSGRGVSIEPPTVAVTFQVRSSIRDHVMNVVNVQIAGPPESLAEYDVRPDPAVLRNVTISAQADLIQRVESGDAYVVAVIHLRHGDLEQPIEQKRITRFAIISDSDGAPFNGTVEARIDGSTDLPIVGLTITKRGEAPE